MNDITRSVNWMIRWQASVHEAKQYIAAADLGNARVYIRMALRNNAESVMAKAEENWK